MEFRTISPENDPLDVFFRPHTVNSVLAGSCITETGGT